VGKAKDEKYYTVRVINPSRGGPVRSIAVPQRPSKNPADCHVCTKSNPRRRNASVDSYERSVLQALAEDAERTEDDWGVSTAIYEYLDNPESYDETPLQYLNAVANDIWWHYKHVGDEDDPMLSKASAKRAEKLVSDAMRDLRKHKGLPNPRRRNPTFRYAAVPVEDSGRETTYVARGKRRDDMLRSVARSVPGDADVDLQRTRTFATKHEATRYAERQSPRVVQLSRRIRNP